MEEPVTLAVIVSSLLLSLASNVLGLCPVPCLNSSDIEIRLTVVPGWYSEDTNVTNVGRVEVCCDGKWGTIGLENENDFWSEKNVQVACVQLGFSGGLNSIIPVNIPAMQSLPSLPVLLHKVACLGSESEVAECLKGGPLPSSKLSDVYIVCRPRHHDYSSVHRAGPQSGDFRLFGSLKNGEGAVEIFTGRQWATLCPDSSWVNRDARILCNALGYDTGTTSLYTNSEDTNYIPTLSNAQCSDSTIAPPTSQVSDQVFAKYCSFTSGPCQTNDHLAGIQCSSLGINSRQSFRLFGIDLFDDADVSGVLEVFEDKRWGMVCTNSSRKDGAHLARLMCRNLLRQDFPNADVISIPVEKLSMYESSMKPIWLDDITCPEDALSITDCDFKDPLGYSDCSNRGILAVRCAMHSGGGGNPLIIVGAIILVVVVVIAILVFLVYLRRVFTRRDRVSVTSVALPDPVGDAENRSERQNGGAMNFLLMQESQLDNIKEEGASGEDFKSQDYGNILNHHPNA